MTARRICVRSSVAAGIALMSCPPIANRAFVSRQYAQGSPKVNRPQLARRGKSRSAFPLSIAARCEALTPSSSAASAIHQLQLPVSVRNTDGPRRLVHQLRWHHVVVDVDAMRCVGSHGVIAPHNRVVSLAIAMTLRWRNLASPVAGS